MIFLFNFRIYLFVIFFISIFSCTNKPNSIEKIKELSISLPDSKNDIWSYSSSIINMEDEEYLAYASKKRNEIGLLNIDNNQVEQTISLKQVIPLHDFKYHDLKFYFHSIDSVFILPNEAKTIFLINKNGNLINEWVLNTNTVDYNFILSAFISSSFKFEKNKLYVRLVPLINSFTNPEGYHKIKPEIIINTTTNEIEYGGGWPEKYNKKSFYDSYPSMLILNEKLIYSYAAGHDLYLFKKDSLVAKKEAKSDYINTFSEFPTDSVGNIAYTMKFLNTTPKYGRLYFDKYRKLYYRLAFHKTNHINKDGKTIKGPLDQPFSILVLDENFKKLNERILDPKKYTYGPIFITKEGVLIPKRGDPSIITDKRSWNFDVLKLI